MIGHRVSCLDLQFLFARGLFFLRVINNATPLFILRILALRAVHRSTFDVLNDSQLSIKPTGAIRRRHPGFRFDESKSALRKGTWEPQGFLPSTTSLTTASPLHLVGIVLTLGRRITVVSDLKHVQELLLMKLSRKQGHDALVFVQSLRT